MSETHVSTEPSEALPAATIPGAGEQIGEPDDEERDDASGGRLFQVMFFSAGLIALPLAVGLFAAVLHAFGNTPPTPWSRAVMVLVSVASVAFAAVGGYVLVLGLAGIVRTDHPSSARANPAAAPPGAP